ncbi:MAG: prepilin-type N-terminal cleavage/methylation domain-containing protein [Candidatus Jorgensenbacteria bacterium]
MKIIRNKRLITNDNRAGFTLTELIVAMSIFIIAITIAVGAFVRAIRTQRAVNHLLSLNSNMSLVIERMAREIRTGYDFGLNNVPQDDCIGNQTGELEFTNSGANSVFYHRESGVITRMECEGDNCAGKTFEPLTAPNVKIERLCFLNTGNLENGKDPWRVTLFLKVGSTEPALSSQFTNIQTTAAARVIPQELQ